MKFPSLSLIAMLAYICRAFGTQCDLLLPPSWPALTLTSGMTRGADLEPYPAYFLQFC